MAGITIPGLSTNGQLNNQAIANLQDTSSQFTGLPGSTDLGTNLNLNPLPTTLANTSDTVGYLGSSQAGQPLQTGIYTAAFSSSLDNQSVNTISSTTGASSDAINSATNAVSNSLPGSLFGVDAGTGGVSFGNLLTNTGASSTSTSQAIRSNILHNYKNYTYRLTLQMLDDDTYNSSVTNPAGYQATNVLIASGGLYSTNTYLRNQYFQDDFYFSSAQLTTVIGANAESRNSNVIDLKFDIIEPYGCTLLNRLMDATASLGAKNYLEIPYLLQIDFVGYDDAGTPVNTIPGTTKYIPIKLIGMTFTISTKGAEYKFEAVPYGHDAYTHTVATIPANIEVSATTIQQLFGATTLSEWSSGSTSTNNQRAESSSSASTNVSSTIQNLDGSTTTTNTQTSSASSSSTATQTIKQRSITDALNNYQKVLLNNKSIGVADQYAFVIDDDIANANISETKRTDIKHTQFDMSATNSPLKDGAASSLSGNQGTFTIDYSHNLFRINAGSSIVDVINQYIQNSTYFTKQMTDPTGNTTSGTQANEAAGSTNNGTTSTTQGQINTTSSTNNSPMYSWKIVPEVSLLGFDTVRNTYAKKITYHIKKYQANNVRHPYAPQGKASTYVKDYQYIFTGENIDIIDFNMNFATTFYTAVTAIPAKHQQTLSQAVIDPTTPVSNTQLLQNNVNPFPNRFMPISSNMSAISGAYAYKDTKTIIAADVTSSLFSKAQADMVRIDLTIIGDPDFIKQDDIFVVDSSLNSNLNGSIATDVGEVYIRLTFATGTDYDVNTGLLRTSASGDYNPTQNVFSGLYKVLVVANTFVDGRFEQTLECVRLPNQATDYQPPSQSTNVTSSERSASGNAEVNSGTVNTIGTGLFSGLIPNESISNAVQANTNVLSNNGTSQVPNGLNILVTGTGNTGQ